MTIIVEIKPKPQNIKINNDNIKINKEYRSPKTYLKECIFEQPPTQKKKKKVSSEEFEILDYTNYNKIVEKNYNVCLAPERFTLMSWREEP